MPQDKSNKFSMSIIGDAKRTSKYDPTLADKLNKEIEEQERLEELERRKSGKKPKKEPVEEPPAEPSKTPIELPNKNLQFITDENLHKDISKYMSKTFPAHAETLNSKFNWDKNQKIATGSNPYIATAIDMFLKKEMPEFRIARLSDLETNLKMFEGTYEDVGLALRNLKNPNEAKAKYLHEQLKKINPKIDFPIYIELRALELDENLNFNLTEESVYKTADCLNWKSGTHYSKKDELGLPKSEDEKSKRQIWTMKDGLSRCFLSRYLNFYSNNDDLAISYSDGRVALARAEGTHAKNFGGSK